MPAKLIRFSARFWNWLVINQKIGSARLRQVSLRSLEVVSRLVSHSLNVFIEATSRCLNWLQHVTNRILRFAFSMICVLDSEGAMKMMIFPAWLILSFFGLLATVVVLVVFVKVPREFAWPVGLFIYRRLESQMQAVGN